MTRGFTLIELLVVLIIIGVLLSIAIPSYLGFQKKAQQTAAMSDVRSAIPDAEAYYSDNNSYTSMTAGGLQTTYDSGLVLSVSGSTGIVSGESAARRTRRSTASRLLTAATGRTSRARAARSERRTQTTAATADPCRGFTG